MKKIKVTFDRYEDNKAIFLTSNKEKIVFASKLIRGIKPENCFDIILKNGKEAKESDEKLAKSILNEILNQG